MTNDIADLRISMYQRNVLNSAMSVSNRRSSRSARVGLWRYDEQEGRRARESAERGRTNRGSDCWAWAQRWHTTG
jgi:hypothetical protein